MSPRAVEGLNVPAIVAEYQEGDSPKVVGQRHGVHPSTIRRRLIGAGVRLRSRREAAAVLAANPSARKRTGGREKKNLDVAAIVAEYERGDSLPVVGRRHGVHTETIRRRLKDAGVRIRSSREAWIARLHATGVLRGLAADLAMPEETVRALLIKHGFIRQLPPGD